MQKTTDNLAGDTYAHFKTETLKQIGDAFASFDDTCKAFKEKFDQNPLYTVENYSKAIVKSQTENVVYKQIETIFFAVDGQAFNEVTKLDLFAHRLTIFINNYTERLFSNLRSVGNTTRLERAEMETLARLFDAGFCATEIHGLLRRARRYAERLKDNGCESVFSAPLERDQKSSHQIAFSDKNWIIAKDTFNLPASGATLHIQARPFFNRLHLRLDVGDLTRYRCRLQVQPNKCVYYLADQPVAQTKPSRRHRKWQVNPSAFPLSLDAPEIAEAASRLVGVPVTRTTKSEVKQNEK